MTPDQFAKQARGAVTRTKPQLMEGAVQALLAELQRTSPVQTGTLQRSWAARVEDGGNLGIVGTDVAHARPVWFGTKPHIIRATNAKSLRFTVGNRVMFAKQVQHPGSQANAALNAAPDTALPAIERELGDYGDTLLLEVAL